MEQNSTTKNLAHQRVTSRQILGGDVSKPSILRAVGRISLAASAVLAPVAFLQCAAGTPSLPVLAATAVAILTAAWLPASSTNGKEVGK